MTLASTCGRMAGQSYGEDRGFDTTSSGSSAFYHYGYRFYNPSTGRWLNRDPIGERGGLNLYGMVGNDALNFADYLGLVIYEYKVDAAAFDRTLVNRNNFGQKINALTTAATTTLIDIEDEEGWKMFMTAKENEGAPCCVDCKIDKGTLQHIFRQSVHQSLLFPANPDDPAEVGIVNYINGHEDRRLFGHQLAAVYLEAIEAEVLGSYTTGSSVEDCKDKLFARVSCLMNSLFQNRQSSAGFQKLNSLIQGEISKENLNDPGFDPEDGTLIQINKRFSAVPFLKKFAQRVQNQGFELKHACGRSRSCVRGRDYQ
jgi:RHS repeat-associated protein